MSCSNDQSYSLNRAFTQSDTASAISSKPSLQFASFLKDSSTNNSVMGEPAQNPIPKDHLQINVKDIDPKNVLKEQIFQLLQQMNDIGSKLPATKDTNRVAETVNLSSKVEANASKLRQVSMQQETCKLDHHCVAIMAHIIIRQHQRIHELNSQILQIQQRSMRNNIIINGIIKREKEDIHALKIQKVYRIGIGQNRPLLIKLFNPSDKGKIFSNTKMLKNVKNDENNVNDQLPEEIAEQRRQNSMFIKLNKTKPVADRLTV